MPLIKAFTGLRPAAGYVEAVAAPPYDVVSLQEAREMAVGQPWSFLHISRPEIDLPEGTDPYADEVYARGIDNLQSMREAGVLMRDEAPCFYLYRLQTAEHQQIGLVAATSVAAYESGRVCKHELTQPGKEDDRTRQIDSLNAQTGPVFLTCPESPEFSALAAKISGEEPTYDFSCDDGVRHSLWVINDVADISALDALFENMAHLYIADGHHRSAAAARVAAKRREARSDAKEGPEDYFLSVIFPENEVCILDYNRVVRDLNGLTVANLLSKLESDFSVSLSNAPVQPQKRGEFGLYVDGQWYRLQLSLDAIPQDPVERLDVSLLTNHLLSPILGIEDLRRDPRIGFVGGIRGTDGLEACVDSGEMAAAFALHPTAMAEVMAVADAGRLMPPKSTWFEPKLADGIVSYVID